MIFALVLNDCLGDCIVIWGIGREGIMAKFFVPVVVVFWRCGLEKVKEERGWGTVKTTVLNIRLVKCQAEVFKAYVIVFDYILERLEK